MDGKELILERRSIRNFAEDYISQEQLDELLEAARYAPSWANTQTPFFIVIRDKDKIRELVENCYPKNRASQCSLQASLVLVACYEKGKSGYYRDMDFNSIGTWAMFDLGSACQNIALQAHNMGLASVLVGAYDYEKAKEIIELDRTKYEVGPIMPIGKRIENAKAPKRREVKDMYRII